MKKKFKGYEEPLSTVDYITRLLSSEIAKAIDKKILEELEKEKKWT